MTYYLLPRSNKYIYKDLYYQEIENNIVISNSLAKYLYEIKEKITDIDKAWDVYKKFTNPYEYIHTSTPQFKRPISKYKPLSRSYFKMIEILHTFSIYYKTSIKSFHLAEGPGGFIEALLHQRSNPNDTYIGMTLLDENADTNIPAWKKSQLFLKDNSNVLLENGIDGTGDILNIDNFEYVVKKYDSSFELVTADGGFDFSFDFNKQESVISKLLFAQIAYGLCIQKKDGTFILKIFDCFMNHTIDLLYLLSSFYKKTYIVKPKTSRYANSEKYIVCSGFLYTSNSEFYSYIHSCFQNMLKKDYEYCRFLSNDIPLYFIQKLEEYNSVFGQTQLKNINYTISLMSNKTKQDKINNLVRGNIQKCIQWCISNKISYNIIPNNLFINYDNDKESINNDK
tara:strand:- start:4398 stop:5588 length:1191 start_codon:yes stop_codon:yes gene_type:complete